MLDGLRLSLLLWLAVATPAHAASLEFLAPFGDVALADPREPTTPGGSPQLYAETGPNPGWMIVQWNIPEAKLSPFMRSSGGDRVILSSEAPEATVQLVREQGGEKIRLAQDGAVLPCVTGNGTPRESDLFISPKGRGMPGPTALLTPRMPLAKLESMEVSAEVRVRYGVTEHPKQCTVNGGDAIVSVILVDLAANPRQTLFYKFGLNRPCGPGPTERLRVCEGGNKRLNFYFASNPFGIDDHLPLLGLPFLRNGEHRRILLDLLPRMRQVIASSPAGMDHDFSHWMLDSAYVGQHIWGDFRLESEWDRFQILLVTK